MMRTPVPPLESEDVSVDGRTIYHRVFRHPSHDRVLVHIHGFGISGTYLEPTAALLAHDASTFVPDLPGTGRSPGAMRGLTINALAETIARYCDTLDIPQACFVGNSLGCPIIVELAASHPTLVERMVLVSPAGGPNNQPLFRAARQLLQVAPREPTSLMRVAMPDYLKFGPVRGASLFRAMTRYPVLDRLHEINPPTLVIIGDRDPLIDIQRAGVAFEPLDHLTAVSIPGAHALNFSRPEELAALIGAFVGDRPIGDVEIDGLELLAGR